MANSVQYERGRSRERSPLISQHSSTSYGAFGSAPRPPGLQPPLPYVATPSYPGDGYKPTHTRRQRRDSSPFHPDTITKLCLRCGIIVFLIILAQAFAFIFFYDLPSKLEEYSNATARMREQEGAMRKEASHLESERIALRSESNRLEEERLALESATLKLEGERDALESAIRRSEMERSRLEREKQLLEDERHSSEQEREALEDERQLSEQERGALEAAIRRSKLESLKFEREKQLLEGERQLLEREREALREERERWEKAREDRVPQDAFWDPLWPAWDCRSYGKREYWGVLNNVPEDWTDLDACMNMPAEIKGVSVRRPDRCAYVEGSPHIHGYWMVDWDQADCKPWHRDFHDTGCMNPGSGIRRVEAQVVGILNRKEQDWRLLCESTPMTWNHITYNSPTHCDERRYGRKVAIWDIPDGSC